MEQTSSTIKTQQPGSQTVTQIRSQEPADIDLLQLFGEFRKNILIIILAALLCGGLAAGYTKLFITPTYESTSVLYVLSKETTLASLADLQIGSQLTEDYKQIVASRPVLEKTIANLSLDTTAEKLSNSLKIDNPKNTRILKITATHKDPQTAKNIADEVASVSSEYIADIMEMIPPKLIEDGKVPTQKSAPSAAKNTMVGMMIGVLAVCAVITWNFITDDTVKTSDDIQKYLNLPVLASIAYSGSQDDSNRNKSGKKDKKNGRKTA